MSMQLVSPAESKQSFPQRALYQGSISPSTPNTQSVLSYSGQKSLKLQHKELAGTLRNLTGCMPVLSETPKGAGQAVHLGQKTRQSQKLDRSDGRSAQGAQAKKSKKSNQGGARRLSQEAREREFNKTGEVPKARNSGMLIQDDGPPESEAAGDDALADETKTEDRNLCHDDQSILTKHDATADGRVKTPGAGDEEKFVTDMKNEAKPSFSPEVSPINAKLQETTMSHYAGTGNCWNDGTSSQPTLTSNEKGNQVGSAPRGHEKHFIQANFRADDPGYNRMKMEDSSQKLKHQLPLQMHPGQHLVYQSYPHLPDLTRSPDARHKGNIPVARYLPVQQSHTQHAQVQQPASLHSTPQRGFHQNPMQMNYATAQQPQQMPMMQSFDPINQSGFLNISHQQQLAEQQSFYYEMVMKEKVESTQLMGQLKEAQRQLEKSRKDYAKLLSQVDEDQEETA